MVLHNIVSRQNSKFELYKKKKKNIVKVFIHRQATHKFDPTNSDATFFFIEIQMEHNFTKTNEQI